MYKTSKLIKDLLKSSNIYTKIVNEIKMDISEFSFEEMIVITSENKRNNFKNNFFSILMVDLIKFLKVDKKNIIEYGKCLFYLRGIITCTDNIIDNESKGVIFLNEIKEDVTKNTLLILILQKKLHETIFKLDKEKLEINTMVLESIYLIAKSEGLRNRNLYKSYPTYNFILNHIHSGIGGELLKIGIAIPKKIEKDKNFEEISHALYNLGMSLQGLDDLCDIKEDFNNGKINLATSFYMERLKLEENSILELNILENSITKEYLNKVIGYSIKCFEGLEKIGYPINKQIGTKLLKHLFEIRGLIDLWEVYL